MDVFDLVAKLRLDSSEYETGLGSAKDTAEKGGSKIGKALGTAAKVGAVVLTAATTAAVAFGKSSVEAGMSFDSAMAQVAATSGKTMEELQKEVASTSTAYGEFQGNLNEFAQFMGSKTAFSATQAAEALNYMALAGYDTKKSMDMLPTVLDLAAAGGMDLARASDMVTDAQSALGLTMDETTTMVDQMAMASSKSNTSVEQLGDAFLTIGATARSVKGGTTELSTILGVLADNGIKGAEGGTHLRNMILSLQSPTTEAAKILDTMNISLYDSDGNMRSLIDVIGDLQTGMEGMDQASKDAVIGGIFNKTDLAAVNALIGTSSERFDELTGYIENATGAATQMANTQLDNLAGDITLFKSALEGAQIAISNQLTPSLRSFVKFGTDSISELTAAFKEDGLAGALEALDGIVNQGIELLFSVLPKVTEAGLALLEAVISGIIKNLPQLIKAGIEIVKKLSSDIIENLPTLIDSMVKVVLALADGIIDALPKLIPAIVETITTIVTKLTEPDTLLRLVQAAFDIIGALAKGLLEAIPTIVSAVPQIIQNLLDTIKGFFTDISTSGFELVGQLAAGLLDGAFQLVDSVLDLGITIRDTFSEIIDAARNWGTDLINNFTNGIKDKWSGLTDTLSHTAEAVKNFLGFSEPEEGPLSNFHTYAPDMMELFAKGIRDNEGMLKDTVSEAFDFGSMTVNSTPKFGNSSMMDDGPITIIVQSVLDGKVIGETATKWQRRQARAFG